MSKLIPAVLNYPPNILKLGNDREPFNYKFRRESVSGN